jgi:hypothetical protein
MKCEASQELVVGGFTDPQGARVGLGALLVGYYDGETTSSSPERSAPASTRSCCSTARAARRARDPEAPFTKATGLPRLRAHWVRPRSSCRSRSSSGPCTASCGIRGCSASASTRRARGRREQRDHASREGAVPGRRHHQGRAGRVLRGDRAGDAAAHPRPAGHDGALPAGIGKKGFWQKDVSKGFPEWLQRVEVPKKDGVVHHPLVTDTRSLLWVANQNTITPHVWTSRAPDLMHPDVCVFDLDPSKTTIRRLRARRARAARSARRARLPSWVKTSGSKGFHIVVPLDGKTPMGEVARFAHAVGGCSSAAIRST